MPIPTAYVSSPRIIVVGQTHRNLDADLVSVLVEDTIEGLYRCEACFNNYGARARSINAEYLYFGRNILNFGADFSVRMGGGDRARQVFEGRISAIEAEYPAGGGALITVLAEDRLQDLRMTRRTRTFEEISDANVIRQIAGEHSLVPQVNLPESPVHKVLAQVNQSDLAFVRERARSLDGELWMEINKLCVSKRTDRVDAVVNLSYGDNLLSFSVRADLAHQCTQLGVSGWNVANKGAIEVEATETAIRAELKDTISGSAVLRQAFGERKQRVVHTVPLTEEEARSLANARYGERARRFITGTGIADGDARIRVGSTLRLSSLGNLFDGEYYVVRVRHSYEERFGFRTTFDVERPGLGQSLY